MRFFALACLASVALVLAADPAQPDVRAPWVHLLLLFFCDGGGGVAAGGLFEAAVCLGLFWRALHVFFRRPFGAGARGDPAALHASLVRVFFLV